MSYEKGQPIFAQVGDACYLCRYEETDMDGSIVVTDIHWVSRKGTTPRAEIEFHRELGHEATGCEILYRGPPRGRVPASALTSSWPWDLPMGDVGDPDA